MLAGHLRIVAHVGRQLHLCTTLAVGTSYEGFARGAIDAGFICGLQRMANKPLT
jgi:hypothetical protein